RPPHGAPVLRPCGRVLVGPVAKRHGHEAHRVCSRIPVGRVAGGPLYGRPHLHREILPGPWHLLGQRLLRRGLRVRRIGRAFGHRREHELSWLARLCHWSYDDACDLYRFNRKHEAHRAIATPRSSALIFSFELVALAGASSVSTEKPHAAVS